MRHRKSGLKLNRTSSHRKAMFRNMATSFFKHERIRTTNATARELRRLVERMITLAKRGDLHARRQALSIIREKAVAHKLFDEIGKRFARIPGGYTRILKLGRRKGDAASLSLIELSDGKSRGRKRKQWPASKPEQVEEEIPKNQDLETEKPLNEEISAAPDENFQEEIEDPHKNSGTSDGQKDQENLKEKSGDKS